MNRLFYFSCSLALDSGNPNHGCTTVCDQKYVILSKAPFLSLKGGVPILSGDCKHQIEQYVCVCLLELPNKIHRLGG